MKPTFAFLTALLLSPLVAPQLSGSCRKFP